MPGGMHSSPSKVSRSAIRRIAATAATAGLILTVLFAVWAMIGVRGMRRALVDETKRQSLALLESLILASQHSLASGALADQLARETQFAHLRTATESIDPDRMTLSQLASLASEVAAEGLSLWHDDRIIAFPAELGSLLASDSNFIAYEWGSGEGSATLSVADTLSDIQWLGSGFATTWGGVASWKLVPSASAPSAIVGIGELIQEIGRQSGINYIMLQAPEGIVFASRPLKPVLKLAADSFLVKVLDHDTASTREIIFEGTPVIEAAAPFLSTDLPSGMFRVGLSLTAVDTAVGRLTMQLGLTAVLLILLSSAVSAVFVARRSLVALGQSYREVETLTGRVLDAIDQAVVSVDGDGLIAIFNPTAERWFGRSLEVVRGRFPSDVLPLGFDLDNVRRSGDGLREREEICETTKGRRELVYSTTPLITSEGRIGAVAVIRDETEARALALQVRRAERLSAMGQLAAGVAHEIRNPLNAVGLASQQLKLELGTSEMTRYADTILAESRRLNAIVDEFLSLARPSTEPKAVVNLMALVDSVAQMARLEADKNQVTLVTQLEDRCEVLGVSDELSKAVWNLIRNALAATPPGGTIRIELLAATGNVRLVVDDTGSGIAKAALPHVFEPWFTTKPGGTGLGLAITHRIVLDHSGRITVESPVPGEAGGTRVVVTLPQLQQHVQTLT